MKGCARHAATLAMVVALAAGACGGTTSTSSGDPSAPGGSGGSSGASASAADAKLGPEEFGLTKDELAIRVEQVESHIGDCMSGAGFEYVPVDFERVRQGMTADKSAPGLNDSEYVDQYGYGITTQFDKPGRELGLGEQNVQTYQNLAPDQQIAYNRALFGDTADATFALTLEAEDFSTTGGCTRKAVEQTFTPTELSADYLNPGDKAMEQDDRMVKAIAKWSTCVADAGYDYSHPDDIENDLTERLQAITDGADPASLSGPANAALTDLQGEERAIAKVATECEADIIEPVVEDIESEIYGAPQG